MIFWTSNELAKHIRLYKRMSVFSQFLTLLMIFAFTFFCAFFTTKALAASIVCLFLCGLCIAALVMVSQYHKHGIMLQAHHPYKILLSREFDYDAVKHIFLRQADHKECREFQNGPAFFCFLNRVSHNRFLLIKTPYFDKAGYDSIKQKVNKAVNQEFQVPNWAPSYKVRKMMRINIIVTNEVNDALYRFLSNNAGVLLSRAEGIINFAIVGDYLVIPPLWGENDMMEISRYERSIKTVTKLLE